MSQINQPSTVSHTSQASQTHERSEKYTEACLRRHEKPPRRPYGQWQIVYSFKPNHKDPETAELIEGLIDALDEALMFDPDDSRDSSGKISELEHVHYSAISGMKRSWADYKLETIPEYSDVATDPMPSTEARNFSCQIDETWFEHQMIEREQMSPLKENSPQKCTLIPPTIKRPSFKVFVDDNMRHRTRNLDPWVLVGPRARLTRRPILASRDEAHPDALSRLLRRDRYIANPDSERNRGLIPSSYNEFPIVVHRTRRTRSVNNRMLRPGDILSIGGVLETQDDITRRIEHANGSIYRRVVNHFAPVVSTRNEPASPPPRGEFLPFWQRAGIHYYVPRIWLYITPTIFPES